MTIFKKNPSKYFKVLVSGYHFEASAALVSVKVLSGHFLWAGLNYFEVLSTLNYRASKYFEVTKILTFFKALGSMLGSTEIRGLKYF